MKISTENLIRDRRNLHRIPELELRLPQTVEYLQNELKDLPMNLIESDDLKGSFLLYFNLGKADSIAFRTDMDALPIQEENSHSFISRNPGKMHACGHDGHMSILLEVARNLEGIKDRLEHNIVLIFQAGEESPGGARFIVESGWLERLNVKAVFGLHLWPSIPYGRIAMKPGPQMARSSEITIDILGKSSHVSRLSQGIDAMESGARLLLELYSSESSMKKNERTLLRFGILRSGTARNAVAESAHLEGTVRALDDRDFHHLQDSIQKIVNSEEARSGAKITVHYSSGYPPLVNDYRLGKNILKSFGDILPLKEADMASEDFSYYQSKFPGVFFFLGTGSDIPLHNSHFDFDEAVLEQGVLLFLKLAVSLDRNFNFRSSEQGFPF